MGKAPPLPRQYARQRDPYQAFRHSSRRLGHRHSSNAQVRHLHGPGRPGTSITHYETTTVEQLEDSPVITGEYFHEFALAPEVTPKHYIDVVSDSPEDSKLRPALLAELNNLVRETGAAYNSRHYNVYHFLLTLSDVAGGEGLEHGESSDNGVGEKGFSDDTHQLAESDLLSHEFTHSWNGKYRRPYNLYRPTSPRCRRARSSGSTKA